MIKAIFSVDSANLDNTVARRDAITTLDKQGEFTIADGVYTYSNGTRACETSYIVNYSSDILKLARRYKQESILLLLLDDAWLVYLDGKYSEYLGKWLEVSKSEAQASSAYTKIGSRYYVTRKVG